MSNINHNPNLIALMTKAVEYFKEKYLTKKIIYDKRSLEVNSNIFNEDLGIVHIYSHLDADGLSAAGILANTFNRDKIPFQITILKQLEEQYFPEIKKNMEENRQFIIFSDFGSGQLNLFQKYSIDSNFIIIDHHVILKEKEDQEIHINGFLANSYIAQVNGSQEISAAGMTYLFAKILNPSNINLSYLAIVGAIGDIQNVGTQKSFIGENLAILNDAESEKLIVKSSEPAITRSKPLTTALFYNSTIDIPDFKKDIKNISSFLSKIGIKEKNDYGDIRTLADLSPSEKIKLTNELIKIALKTPNFNPASLDDMIETNYLISTVDKYPQIYDGKDFSKMLNACGRLNNSSAALSMLLTFSDDSIKKTIDLMEKYSKSFMENARWLEQNNKLQFKKSLIWFYGEDKIDENQLPTICTNLVNKNKDMALIGYADSDSNMYKISARCSKNLLDKGVNLNEAIRDVTTTLNLEDKGGGHPAASGAKIPKINIEQFLDLLDQKLLEQSSKKSKK